MHNMHKHKYDLLVLERGKVIGDSCIQIQKLSAGRVMTHDNDIYGGLFEMDILL